MTLNVVTETRYHLTIQTNSNVNLSTSRLELFKPVPYQSQFIFVVPGTQVTDPSYNEFELCSVISCLSKDIRCHV